MITAYLKRDLENTEASEDEEVIDPEDSTPVDGETAAAVFEYFGLRLPLTAGGSPGVYRTRLPEAFPAQRTAWPFSGSDVCVSVLGRRSP